MQYIYILIYAIYIYVIWNMQLIEHVDGTNPQKVPSNVLPSQGHPNAASRAATHGLILDHLEDHFPQ